jgi:hypothetical protein
MRIRSLAPVLFAVALLAGSCGPDDIQADFDVSGSRSGV